MELEAILGQMHDLYTYSWRSRLLSTKNFHLFQGEPPAQHTLLHSHTTSYKLHKPRSLSNYLLNFLERKIIYVESLLPWLAGRAPLVSIRVKNFHINSIIQILVNRKVSLMICYSGQLQ